MSVSDLMAGTSVRGNSEPEYNLDNLNEYVETMIANKIDKSKLRRVSLYVTMGGNVLEYKNLMPEFSTILYIESSIEYIGDKEMKLSDLSYGPVDDDIINQLSKARIQSKEKYQSLYADLKHRYPDKFQLRYSTPKDSYELENKKSQQFDFIMYEGDKLELIPANDTNGVGVFKVNSNDIPNRFTIDNTSEDEIRDRYTFVVGDEDLDIQCHISYHQSDEHLDSGNMVPFYNIKINKEGKSDISEYQPCQYAIESIKQEIDPIALMSSKQVKLPRNYSMGHSKYVERPIMKITSDDNKFGFFGYNIYITTNSEEARGYGNTVAIDILRRNTNSNSTIIPTCGTIDFDLLNQGIKYVKYTEGPVIDFRNLVDTIYDKLKNINKLNDKFEVFAIADELGSSIMYDNSDEYNENDKSFLECIALPNHEVIINLKDYEGSPCIESNLFYMLNDSVEDIAERYIFYILFQCFIGSESELKELCGELCPNCILSDRELRIFGYRQERYNSMHSMKTEQPESNFLM